MNVKANVTIVVIIVILLGIIFVWGFVGGQEAQKVGVTCDMGIEETLCWKWHKNIMGKTEEAINNLFGGNR